LLYSFEDFSLDTARRELRRGGALISLQRQVFDLLEYLIRNRERVVGKDEVLAAVWNGRIVSEANLSTRINAARSAIGDSGEEQRLIRTAHGKGFRFVGAVCEEEEAVRKLAAIFAADAEGYSRLMERDEVGTLRRLTAYRAVIDERIAAHRGRIFGSAGDRVIADFASAVDAVQCAVAVQDAIGKGNNALPADQQLRFRIGVHIGDVLVKGENLFGDGVNIAARLKALAEPGGICVSAAIRDQIGSRLPLAFTDLDEQQVKNISQRVHVYSVAASRMIEATEAPAPGPLLPDKPSIAVLPFVNMSSNPGQEFLTDGIAEDIITSLSRYSELFVIARNSSFTYKDRTVDVKRVGRELGVRYVLEGSLRSAGNRVRVTAQLVEAEAGNHVWANRYDRDLSDIFALQDEITEAVATAVAPAIADAERQRAMRKPPGSLDAWAAYQRGLWHMSKFTSADNQLAEKYFQQAIDLDPNFGGGYRGLARAILNSARAFGARGLADAERAAEPLARRAIALDSADAEAHVCLSSVIHGRADDREGTIAEAETALAMSPNLASAHGSLGAALAFSGRPKEGLTHLETCIRLDPHDPHRAARLHQIALAHYLCRDYMVAAEAARRAIRSYPDHPTPYRWLAAALGQMGRVAEGKETLEKAVAIAPAFSDMYLRRRVPWMRPEDHAHVLEGLRKAGWEC
jgi:adenylate cyclase